MEETEKKDNKLQSRKFLVWFVWLILSVIVMAISLVMMIVTKNFPDTIVDLIKLVLEYFFYISLTYLSVNGITKVGFAVSDALSGKANEEECSKSS